MSKLPLAPFKLVPVPTPRLKGKRGGIYYLDNKPTAVPGREHLEFRRLRKPPSPLVPANPTVYWNPPDATLESTLWGRAADTARSDVTELVQRTARQLNIRIVNDDSRDTGAVVRRPPLNVIHVREIRFITCQIIAAARHFNEWSLAWADDLVVPRKSDERITVAWENHNARTTERLRSLLRAAVRGTQARLELQWYQAPSAMRYFIWRAAAELQRAERHAVYARAIVPGDMISTPIPSRVFLRAVLPQAIMLSAGQRGRRMVGADVFLGVVREMFLMIVGDGTDRLRVKRLEVPNGAGADFVHAIEEIFDVRLLSEASLHAVDRVRELKLPAITTSGPYLRTFLVSV